MKNDLKTLFLNHSGKITDNWALYVNELDNIFYPYQNQSINVLAFCIGNGGMLEVYSKYFANAKKIIGCDPNVTSQMLEFDDPRISLITGNYFTDEFEARVLQQASNYDIIIIDGVHHSDDLIRHFTRYFKHVNEKGIYLIKHLYSSYWAKFNGGLYNPFSAMAFFKRLADIINYEHWRDGQHNADYLSAYKEKFGVRLNKTDLSWIHSIHFYNSLCIIQKTAPDNNKLGKRIVTGLDELITNGLIEHNGTSIIDQYPEIQENQSDQDIFSCMEKTRQLEKDISERDNIIETLSTEIPRLQEEKEVLQAKLDDKEQEVLYYALSKSWKITRPLRKFMKLLKRKDND